MNQVTVLHREAMDLADEAMRARHSGDFGKAGTDYRRAFDLEKEAAALVRDAIAEEPTRSVLHRSAASLALECSEFREAERLIATALSGQPPEEIAEELRDLLEQVHFNRHLETRGVMLSPNELQLAISGERTGLGMVEMPEFMDRAQATEKLLVRVAERRMHRSFRDGGAAPKEVRDNLQLFLSVPRAASFAVTIRIGHTAQRSLPGAAPPWDPECVVDELMSCLDLFDKQKHGELEARIPDRKYRRNFEGLAKQLAPDGTKVKLVGLTAVRGKHVSKVALTKPRPVPSPTKRGGTGEYMTVEGRLLLADQTRRQKEGRIVLVDENDKHHSIVVPDGMMSDIVRPLWDHVVAVSGHVRHNSIVLEEIRKVEE